MNRAYSAVLAKAKEVLTTEHAYFLLTVDNWSGLTQHERRQAVVLDAMASLILRQYEPAHTYIDLWPNRPRALRATTAALPCQMQDLLLEGRTCDCCELGSLFLSLLKFENNLRVDQVCNEASLIRDRLTPLFTEQELSDIESAYEERQFGRGCAKAVGFRTLWLTRHGTQGKESARRDRTAMLLIGLNILQYGKFQPGEPTDLTLKTRRKK